MTTFKPFQISDIDNIVVMMHDFYAIDGYPIDVEMAAQLLQTFIADDQLGKGWLIVFDDKIIGYVVLTFVFSFEYKGRIAFLDELYLAESSRGKGIGKQVVDFVHQKAVDLDIKIIYLEVEGHNKTAQKLYLSKDFVIHNRQLMKLIPKNPLI